MSDNDLRNLAIIGSGPAGWTAAIYAARAELKPVVYTGRFEDKGGQLYLTTEVENYPGFAKGILGPELVDQMEAQAKRFGAEVVDAFVDEVDFSSRPFLLKVGGKECRAKSVIISTGSAPRRLGLESETKYWGHGVTACATCDGAFFKDRRVVVVGGGDSAMEEATFLTRYCTNVYMSHRRNELRASKIMARRALDNPKIEFWFNTVIVEVLGTEEPKKMTGLRIEDTKTGGRRDVEMDGLFLAIGHLPFTDIFRGKIDLNEDGTIKTDRRMRTSVDGVFAAGDVQDSRYRQAITAAGTGCQAALEVEKHLESLH